MAYWLFKSEPEVWSWTQQKAKGAAGEEWTGVRNYQARNNMRAMKLGDRGFFYHSNDGKAVVGIVEVCRLAHRDSTSDVDTWDCVDIRAVADVPMPVTLDAIKLDPKLKDMVLVKNSRLSVQPVTSDEFKHICRLGGVKA
ncbi:MAG: EVE domain-containing protein [Hyphomicrobiales bacterium]|jgi:predicted RNA-binding protein with PUA-like domain|nr:MAG: EVE domain-containing protein [Hyphomicrobiales bacterium]